VGVAVVCLNEILGKLALPLIALPGISPRKTGRKTPIANG
jgi:hypothetical protein